MIRHPGLAAAWSHELEVALELPIGDSVLELTPPHSRVATKWSTKAAPPRARLLFASASVVSSVARQTLRAELT
jgi:hypothetical protein